MTWHDIEPRRPTACERCHCTRVRHPGGGRCRTLGCSCFGFTGDIPGPKPLRVVRELRPIEDEPEDAA